MSTNFSFNVSGQRDYAVSNAFSGTQERLASEGQKKYYTDLCAQRKIAPKPGFEAMTVRELAMLIENTKSYYPASQQQLDLIGKKLANLQEMGCNIHVSDEQMNALTGGKDGTASKMIADLIELEKQYVVTAKPSEAQLKLMVSMFLCPDVDFESFGIKRRIDLADGQWRRPTPDEFAQDIASKMFKQDASKFIDDYRGAYHAWVQTRITIEQKKYIRTLESRMANTQKTTVMEWAWVDGKMQQVSKDMVVGFQDHQDGYKPLDDIELDMFSEAEASKYIDQLKAELLRKAEMSSYGEVSDGSMTFEELRNVTKDLSAVKTIEKARQKESEFLQDLCFKLESVAGMESPELHEAMHNIIGKGYHTASVEADRRFIRDFMLELIEKDCIDFGGLANMMEDSEIAINLLIGR